MQRIRFGNAIQYCIADLLIPENESILRALGPVCNSFQAHGWHFVGAVLWDRIPILSDRIGILSHSPRRSYGMPAAGLGFTFIPRGVSWLAQLRVHCQGP